MSSITQHILQLFGRPGRIKSFEHELRSGGELVGRSDIGLHPVAVEEIVGSVDRWQSLRADFLNRHGPAMTERHRRIEAIMRSDRPLPPLALYRLRVVGATLEPDSCPSEYYVVDGHHRVAMARRLGQDFLDAHVVEYRLSPSPTTPGSATRSARRATRRSR